MADPKITISVSNKGKDGYTPQRGVDYWTDEDKQEIRDYVDERVEEAGGTVSSVNGKTGKVQLTAADVGAQPAGNYALKSELPSVPSKLSELSDDSDHRLTTDEEKAVWNDKSDFSGEYDDLRGKPDIPTVPTNVSAFTNDAGYLTEHQDLIDYAKKSDIPDTSAFITRAVNDLENYYKKSETYNRDEIDQRISAIPKFSIAVVYVLPTDDISETTIYLVPGGSDGDLYTEYIYVNGSWEVLGSQRVDLTGYATQNWTLEQLAGYQPKGNYLTEVTAENIKSALGYTPADAEEVNQLSEKIPDEVPAYWLDELGAKADAIQQAMEAAGRNKSAFLWYTDAHWPNSAKVSPMLLNYLIRNTAMNKVNFGGDIVGDPASFTHENIKYVYEWREMIAGIPNHHSVPGNHDLNHNTTDVRNMAYAYVIAPEESADMVMGGDLYYYIDNPAEKTRYIYLDYMTSVHEEMVAQGQFIVDAINGVDDGWHIVVIGHRWFQYTETSAPTVGSVPIYEADILSVFDAYNARTTRTESNYFAEQDFTGATGKVEFCIGGHIHVDHDFTTDGGIPVILTASDTNQERSSAEDEDSGTVGTITESAVYGIIADYTNNKITVVGVGRGGSRVIDGTSAEPSVLLSLDRTFESGTSGEQASSTLNSNNSKAYLNVSYDTGNFNAKSNTVSNVTENGITVTEPGVGGVCVAYPVYLPDLKTQAYKLSFDYAPSGSYKTRAYWRGIYPDLLTWGPINTIVSSGSGESGHVDFDIPATTLFETIVIFFSSNTGGTTTFSNVSLTEA